MRNGPQPGSPRYARIVTMIQIRLAELQGKTSRDLENATEDLHAATGKLVSATWGLFMATAVLVGVEVFRLVFHQG